MTEQFSVSGKHNTAKVYAPYNQVDELAKDQIRELVSNPDLNKAELVFMPDVHGGKGATIGTTLRFEKFEDMKINPEWVGNDIGCSVSVYHLGNKDEIDLDFDKLDKLSKSLDKPSDTSKWKSSELFEHLTSKKVAKRAEQEIGRISGGNHMMEIGIMDDEYYVTIHNGSLFLGQYIYKKWMDVLKKKNRVNINPIISELKSQGQDKYIETVIKSIKEKQAEIEEKNKYLSDRDLREYIRDVGMCTYYAHANHDEVYKRVRDALGVRNKSLVPKYRTTHNFIDGFNIFLGVDTDKPLTVYKGATPAQLGQGVVIPINMRDGVIVGIGKGNPNWNHSAPHGAGRMMSRTQAKLNIELDTYLEQMKDVRSISINENTLDEAPDAYKSIDYILDQIKDTVKVEGIIKPLYNFKVADEEPHWMRKKKEKKANDNS